jgi:hypothetical protein
VSWLLDPRAFNVLILILFAAAAIRWAVAGNWLQALYFLCAFGLNISVTWMDWK